MSTRRTHVVMAHELVEEIDRVVGKRHRSEFLAEAAAKELMRRRQLDALRRAAGAWKDANHPDLRRGSAFWVRQFRKESDSRLARSGARR